MGRTYHLEQEQLIPRPLEEVFAFFGDARNLEAITPDALHFEILTPLPLDMRPGAVLDYRLRLLGVPFYWQTRIETWDPPHSFSDVQLKGPYERWHHAHAFRPVEGGTLMTDAVDYEMPLGPLGALAHWAFVRRQVQQIFAYRRQRIEELMGAVASAEPG